jgi:hypothetical protein
VLALLAGCGLPATAGNATASALDAYVVVLGNSEATDAAGVGRTLLCLVT